MRGVMVLGMFAAAIAVALAITEGYSAVVVLLALAPLGASVAFRQPVLLIGAVVASHGFNISLAGGALMLTPFKFAFLALCGVSAAHLLRRRSLTISPRIFYVAMLALLVMRALSDVLATSAGGINELPEMFASAALVFLAAQFLRTIDDHRQLTKLYLVVLIITGLWILRETPPGELMSSENVRALGPANQPNETGRNATMLFFLSVPMVLDKGLSLWWRVAAAVGVLAYAYVQFGTSSRGVLASATAALIVLAWFLQADTRRRIASIAAIAMLMGLFVLVAPKSFTHRIKDTVREADVGEGIEVNDSARVELASLAIEMIEESPLIGHGEYGFEERSARHFNGRGIAVHTAYLGVAVAFGVPFALLWTAVMVGAFFLAIRLASRATGPPRLYYAGLSAALAFKLIFSVSTVEFFDQISWLHIGLAYHYYQIDEEHRAAEPQDDARHVLGPLVAAETSNLRRFRG